MYVCKHLSILLYQRRQLLEIRPRVLGSRNDIERPIGCCGELVQRLLKTNWYVLRSDSGQSTVSTERPDVREWPHTDGVRVPCRLLRNIRNGRRELFASRCECFKTFAMTVMKCSLRAAKISRRPSWKWFEDDRHEIKFVARSEIFGTRCEYI